MSSYIESVAACIEDWGTSEKIRTEETAARLRDMLCEWFERTQAWRRHKLAVPSVQAMAMGLKRLGCQKRKTNGRVLFHVRMK